MSKTNRKAVTKSLLNNEGRKQVMAPAIKEMIGRIEVHLFTAKAEYNEKKYTKHDLFRMVRTHLVNIYNSPLEVLAMADATDINKQLDEYTNKLVKEYQS